MRFAFKVFNKEQEAELTKYIIRCSQHYYGISIYELKQLAYEFAVKEEKVVVPKNWEAEKLAGRQWYYGFMLRHKNLSLRTPQQTSLNRVKAFCRENVDLFFRNLDAVFAKTSFGPSDIWNMDETGFTTVPNNIGKILSLKGLKRVGQITSAERGSLMTLALAVSASGNSIPPFYIFPRKKMSPTYMEYASKESVGYANGSGWMQQDEFGKFMHHFIKYSRSSIEAPTLLLLDNHSSHLSIAAIDLAREHGVTILSFPPHCSHRMQPLDVSVFKPVKGAYTIQHNSWMRENPGRALDIMHIPMLVRAALLRGATAENIVSGFKNTGISPFNPAIFGDSDFILLGEDEENQVAAAVEEQYDQEEQRRIVVDTNALDVAANETIEFSSKSRCTPIASTSAASTSRASTSVASTSDAQKYAALLTSIGPLRTAKTPKKKTNRGPKPQKSTVLTSPESVSALIERDAKREAAKEKKLASAEKRKAKSRDTTPKMPAAKKPKK